MFDKLASQKSWTIANGVIKLSQLFVALENLAPYLQKATNHGTAIREQLQASVQEN